MTDMHMHSCYSEDGEFLPEELAEMCADKGIAMMSVTDHNTVRGNAEAKKAAEERRICYIPGIEIDCVFEEVNFHVLGYDIDFQSSDFADIEKNIEDQSRTASRIMLEKTQALGFHITEADMQEISKENYWKQRWTGEMFAEVLLNKPEYQKHPLLKPYRAGESRGSNPYVNFYWDFYSQGKACHAAIKYPEMEEIIDMIHQNHGTAVLAHPGANLRGRESMLQQIMSLDIDGIEAFSSYHTMEEAEYYYQKAVETGKYVTCGSDFHGKTKPSVTLGSFETGKRSELRTRFWFHGKSKAF